MLASSTGGTFAEEVRRLLADRKLSLRALAARVGVDPGFLVRVLQGKQPPSQKLLSGVSAVFDLPNDYFLDARREMVVARLSRTPPLVDLFYDQLSQHPPGSTTGASSPGSAESIGPEAVLRSAADDPRVVAIAAAALYRYRGEKDFRRAVDAKLPEVEELARKLGRPEPHPPT